VRGLLAAAGFDAVTTRRDLAAHERCTGGRWPGPPSPARRGATQVP
jgi:release factor glutamine methyltransferase